MMVNINVSNMTNSWILRLFIAEIAIIIAISAMSTATSCEDSQRLQGPVIHPCKSEVILQKGQNFTLTCKSKRSEVEFRQQELPEEMTTLNLMQKNETVEEDEYMYKTVLELYNVDQYNIGYYACFDTTLRTNVNDTLNNLTTEPNNTEHISFIYIYVNGTGNLFAPMREVVTSRNNYQVVIECRPTTPDVEVTLQTASNKTPDAIRYSPKIGFLLRACSRDAFKCEGRRGNDTAMKRIRNVTPPPVPKIYGGFNYFLEGETFSLNCTVAYQPSDIVNLYWEYPRKFVMQDSMKVISNEYELRGTILYRNITIVNATKENNGTYICVSKNNCGQKEDTFTKIYLKKAFLRLTKNNDRPVIETIQKRIKLDARMEAYPPATFYFLRDSKSLPTQPSKYSTSWYNNTGYVILQIFNLTVTDTANYTLVATNGHLTEEITFDLRVEGAPVVDFRLGDKKYMEKTEITLMCNVIGYPLPQVDWIFSNDMGDKPETLSSSLITVKSVYEATAYIKIQVSASGNITCKASNRRHITSVTRRLLVYEIEDGFGVKNRENMWFSQNQNVTVTCIASIYDFASVTWIGRDDEYLNGTVEHTRNPFSLVAILRMPKISLNQSGEYTCRGLRLDGNEEDEPVNITVAALLPPRIKEQFVDKIEEVYPSQKIQLACQAEGVPLPTIKWSKDDVLMENDSNVEIVTRIINRTVINSTLLIKEMDDDYKGTYKCLANSTIGEASKFYTVMFKVEGTYATYLSIIIVIIFILIVIVIYLTLKVRKEKQFRRELAAAGLLYFKEGVPKSINPDLGIDEQAELLPYDEKFEFPREKLILGKQLGAGAFGVVYKAQARGIINAEETTEVAVKMVKKTADNMYIKALASELKIMVHLGQHVNIVNLLGACTKDVGKRELSVIVEYCKFGNIHNYMQKHREVFIDQLTDNKEKNLGKVNRGFSCSTGSSGVQSDYFGTSNTQETDHTFINTGNSNRSTRKGKPTQVVLVRVSGGYAQPLWRSNYVSDYSFDGRNPRPLTSRDLLAWAFQIARGMEYLASRKVLHGDLAARNVLLADDNVVKICDFGLARSIYKNDEYHKTENSLLPVKWLAIECMTDRIFSTQSDVWSYGIVLWELFSLAKTPYPNISPSDLLRWLAEGKRMSKPPYADDRLYDVMLKCWDYQPTMRPSFTQLQQIMGSFLEDNVRTHLVDLNATYVDKNAQEAGHEDYLIKMSAPDYNNLVTPSPHHYVNETKAFFPVTPTQVDDEGYLQRKVFSPRLENNKFNFDARNFNTPGSEASSCGSESTPMLTLNNLTARSGSESDQESTASPYITICTTIDEETDEVFEPKHNDTNNAIINTAVTNPTYITLDADIETKPKDINHSYINVPNNLVK